MIDFLTPITLGFVIPVQLIWVAGLLLAAVILVASILLFRSTGKKKGTKTAQPGGTAGWQPQGQQQQGMASGWQQQATGGVGANDHAWGQQPGAWGAQNPAPQQPGTWGTQPPAPQQVSNLWGNQNMQSTPPVNPGMGGNQASWDANSSRQTAQDPWAQQHPQPQSAGPPQQGTPAWGGMGNYAPLAREQNAPAQQGSSAYGGANSGSNQTWGQVGQAGPVDPWALPSPQQSAPAQQAGWGQPFQQQVSANPSGSTPAAGGTPAFPTWQQNQGQVFSNPNPPGSNPSGSNPSGSMPGGSGGYGATGMKAEPVPSYANNDGDKTILRNTGPQGSLGIVRVEEGKEPGRIYEVRKDNLSIGRSRDSDIFLEDLAVSRLHASIMSLGNGNYVLKDESSANGTKVNGQMVNKNQTYPLQDGDKIQLGQTVLVFARR